jgi:hypothetical protein
MLEAAAEHMRMEDRYVVYQASVREEYEPMRTTTSWPSVKLTFSHPLSLSIFPL